MFSFVLRLDKSFLGDRYWFFLEEVEVLFGEYREIYNKG